METPIGTAVTLEFLNLVIQVKMGLASFDRNLEMSNVDLANEFTEMIITSRAFQAIPRTITTSDEMLQELINLKRIVKTRGKDGGR